MHEVALMTQALQMAVEAVQTEKDGQNGEAGRLSVLRLRVGALSGAVPSALAFAWDVVRRGTPAETARLEIEMVPAAGWCAQCKVEFDCSDFLNECPRCHNPCGELRRGRELEIASVELN
jgi:hydrogenase nickel incorporation protein HypA/HybF